MKILAIDTATENCSAAIWIDGEVMQLEVEAERGHGERILAMVDQLLAESSIKLSALDAIAFGRGPGSFTGVRLAASVTQGLAFGANLPVVPISDLRAVAQRAATHRVLVCNDARMQEVYWSCFQRAVESTLMEPVGIEHVSKCAAVELPPTWLGTAAGAVGPIGGVGAVGRGFRAYAELKERLGPFLSNIEDDLLPRAREIAVLAEPEIRAGRLLPAEEAIPVYVRDDVARPKVP